MQPQVGVVRVGGRIGQRGDHGQHDGGAHAAARVPPAGAASGPRGGVGRARRRRRGAAAGYQVSSTRPPGSLSVASP